VHKPADDQRSAEPITWDLRRAFDSAFPWAADTDPNAGTGDTGAGSGDGGEGEAGSGKGDADAGDTGAGEDPEVKDPEKKRLSDEAASHRNKAKAEKERADKLAEELKALTDKDKSDLEKAQRDLAELKPKLETANATIKAQAIKLAFFDSGAAKQFKSTTLVLKNLDLDGIEVDDEGNVDAKVVKQKADAFLKEHPYLAADSETDNGVGGETGSPSGKPNNGKRSKDQVDYEALAKKFPALRR
jgi:hypothetical protein